MIQHVNDMIERTHRLTGMPREEIVRRGLIRKEIPMYGIGGAAAMGPWRYRIAISPRIRTLPESGRRGSPRDGCLPAGA